MSEFSGYDSEVVGFASVNQNKRSGTTSSTQTYFTESGTASQTNLSRNFGCNATPQDLNAEDDILKEYPPPGTSFEELKNEKGLNDFLRKVVPGMLEQLNENTREFVYNSSDSDEEDTLQAKLFQELDVKVEKAGAGDFQPTILGLTWSSAGNSLAVTIGQAQHENWCEHDGLIRVYTVKRSQQDKLVHSADISEKNCVSVLKYHPSVSALLAYGTTSGEVVLCNLRNTGNEDGMPLSSPSGCHGSKRVSALQWAEPTLANMYLIAQIGKTGKRRGASDQILISSGCDGTVNVWQVNANLKIFENVITYNINGSKMVGPVDITCFDFIKVYPLRPSEEKHSGDIFVVGTKTGSLLLCKTKTDQLTKLTENIDPVYEVLEGHSTCVLNLAFSYQKPGIFASISMDSELRVYDVNQAGPLKVLCLDMPISCMSWLPNNPCIAILGLSRPERDVLKVYNVNTGREVKVEGFSGGAGVTAISVNQSGSCRIAAGDADGNLRVFDLPTRRIRLTHDDLEY